MSDMPSVASEFELTPQLPASQRTVDVLVVGRDALGIDVCRRLTTAGRRVAAIWPADATNLDEMEALGVEHFVGDASRAPVLSQAGVRVAATLVAVSNDDQFNLRVALAARDQNPGIRIVLRQFNRRLGQKIVRQLANSEAVSPETHSAATYAASCLNRWVYHALEFPRYTEELMVFCRGSAEDFGVVGTGVGELLQRRGWHVLASGGRRFCEGGATIEPGDEVTIACRLSAAPGAAAVPERRAAAAETRDPILFERRRGFAEAVRRIRIRIDPIFLGLFAAFVVLVAGAVSFFHNALGLRWLDAFFYVANTVTTTGADVVTPLTDSARFVEIALMFGSISIVGVLLAYATAAITRRSIELAQGRHQIFSSDHVIVCGFGNVGSRVSQYLLNHGRRVVVIDRNPDSALADEMRARGAHVMTADATSESVMELVQVKRASALLALTDSDAANLEIALTAGAYSPTLPVILRISEAATARAVERHFKIRASYSAAELAAPLVAGLALERGSRGTVDVAGQAFPLVQRRRGGAEVAANELVLATDGDFMLVMRTSL